MEEMYFDSIYAPTKTGMLKDLMGDRDNRRDMVICMNDNKRNYYGNRVALRRRRKEIVWTQSKYTAIASFSKESRD